jgi:hypothetical protein
MLDAKDCGAAARDGVVAAGGSSVWVPKHGIKPAPLRAPVPNPVSMTTFLDGDSVFGGQFS